MKINTNPSFNGGFFYLDIFIIKSTYEKSYKINRIPTY